MGVDCELLANNNELPYAEKYSIANKINNAFDNSVIIKSNLQDSLAISSIKNKTTDDKIVFTRAYKGNTVITIPHDDFVNKTNEFLNNYDRLELDPTKEYQDEIIEIINKCLFFGKKELYFLTAMIPQPPKIYSLVKLHKAGNPIRPTVFILILKLNLA